jgi:plasmid stabilization system protein ParE
MQTQVPRDAHWRLSGRQLKDCRTSQLGMPTEDPDIRQIVIRFGASGYIIRYAILHETADVLITRVWHGREARV